MTRDREQRVDADGGNNGDRIEVETQGSTTVVRPHGEMDIVRAAGFHEALEAALASSSSQIVVDLQHLAFCDSSGLNVLLGARNTAIDSGQSLSLAAPGSQFLRLLEMTGSRELFTIEPAAPF
ncbi:STAS domain-containing protein [Streptomyces sp. NPDC127110]|uniref:STAS domain-containing protein n=1 Tax=Streptomyces sp. NPDC127110 TaxID=3345362 RepID=UPI00362A1BDB